MKSIIVDDENTSRSIIEQLSTNNNHVNVITSFSSAVDAIKYLNQEEVELVFLDIHMPAFSGFDFIQTLKNPPKVIITTSDKNFALDAFEYKCIVDYLVKPLNQERFDKAINKAMAQEISQEINQETTQTSVENDLYVNIDRRLVKINIPDIYLIEAKGDYINIKTEAKNHLVHSTLKKIEEKLPDTTFLKIHRSYIINATKIIDIEDNSVLIKQDVVPVSRANRSELMRRLNLL